MHVYRLPTCAGGMSYSLYLNITFFMCVFVQEDDSGSGEAGVWPGSSFHSSAHSWAQWVLGFFCQSY